MSRSSTFLIVVAGLYGALGVATAAAAAHMTGDTRLQTASLFLMLHAAALLGGVGTARGLGLDKFILLPAWGIAIGALLFCGDLIIRVAFGASPLPMIAPIGGTVLIASWLALSIGAALGARRRPVSETGR